MTTEIPLKECSAYEQIDRGGGEREQPHIYEHPQWLCKHTKKFDLMGHCDVEYSFWRAVCTQWLSTDGLQEAWCIVSMPIRLGSVEVEYLY